MEKFSATLPWPPSLNRAYRAVNGRVLLSEAGRAYVAKCANVLAGTRAVPLTGRLFVRLQLCAPSNLRNKTWDIANREKVLSDALTKLRVWNDDSQIDGYWIARGAPDPAGTGCALVQVSEVTPTAD